MNKTMLLSMFCLLLSRLTASAQAAPQPIRLELAYQKTTSLIFPYAIQSVDRGSAEVLAQLPAQVSNVLQVKAARKGMAETNLTVITADGRLYTFPVLYKESPGVTLIRLEAAQAAPVQFTGSDLNQRELENTASQLVGDKRFLYGPADKAGGAKAAVEGIYIRGNTLFYRVVLTNTSPLPYELEDIRFTLRDRKKARRTATQEEELTPLYTYFPDDQPLEAGQRKVLVFALRKHALVRGRELVLNLYEKNGGRHLTLRIRSHTILQACTLLSPDEPAIRTEL